MKLNDRWDSSEMGTNSQYCLRWNNHRNNLLAAFSHLLSTEAFTDVTLACEEGVTLQAHRLVLASCSSYFQSLFLSAQPSQHPIVVLKDVRSADMRALLEYMYRGEVNIEQNALQGLLKVADSLKVKGLVEELASDFQPHRFSSARGRSPPARHHGPPLPPQPPPPPLSLLGIHLPPTETQVHQTSLSGRQELLPSRLKAEPLPPTSNNAPSLQPKTRSLSPSYPLPVHLNVQATHGNRDAHHRPRSNSSHSAEHQSDQHPGADSVLEHGLDHRDQRKHLPERTEAVENPNLRDSFEGGRREERHPPTEPRDLRHPLSIIHSIHHHIPQGPDSPPIKRKRQLIPEPLLSPTPILRTALANAHGFPHADVTSLVSLASMMPIPGLLNTPVPHSLSQNHVDPQEPLPYHLHIKKDSDDDSRSISDTPREEDHQDKYLPYSVDPNGPSHYNSLISYVPTPKPEWKRYKQYTKGDLLEAIEAVKNGMTALQASRKYKVPSRTLYDKIKKMGISTIPRRLPTKKETMDIEGHNDSLLPSEEQRPISSESYDLLQTSCDNSGTQKQEEILHEVEIKSEPQEKELQQQENVMFGARSFPVLGNKVYETSPDDSPAVPLDLTETADSIVPTRQEIKERA